MPAVIEPLPFWEQTFTELCVILTGAIMACGFSLAYFRRVRMERPPVGAFNGRDVVALLIVIGILPFVYGWMPIPFVTCFLVLASGSALYIGYSALLGRTGIWLAIGLLFGFNIWTSNHLMGTLGGWQLWFIEQSISVVLVAVAISNLYVQGGMKLRHVAWLALGLAGYDILFASYYPLTGRLIARYLTHPLIPIVGIRIGFFDYAIGLGDLLVYSLFFIAAYKGYGARAAAIAGGVIVVAGGGATAYLPYLFNLTNANLDTLIPAQSVFGPVAFATYVWMKRHYGKERTMAEYWADTDGEADTSRVAQQAPVSEPVTAATA